MRSRDRDSTPIGVDLVIFDCDGVLVDSELISCGALRQTLDALGLSLTMEEIFASFLGRDFGVIAAFVEQAIGRPVPESFRGDLRQGVLMAFAEKLTAIAGVSEAIDRLCVPACVASSSDIGRVTAALGQVGLLHHFESRIWTAEQVARGKPAPDLFLLAASSMQADPARTLVIEDSVSGVRAARNAGMQVWGFVGGGHYGYSLPSLSDAGADLVFDDMAALWGLRRQA